MLEPACDSTQDGVTHRTDPAPSPTLIRHEQGSGTHEEKAVVPYTFNPSTREAEAGGGSLGSLHAMMPRCHQEAIVIGTKPIQDEASEHSGMEGG
ncbi:hypothetical protein STEG23_028094 [Scotinomys teguina]